jgi:sugar O-acyltransferase (sialic acid O-acetyltransferase NeuD family)
LRRNLIWVTASRLGEDAAPEGFMTEPIGIFGAGGLVRQIIDFLPRDTLLFTDEGGGELHGFPIIRFDEAPHCELAIAVSDPTARRKVALRWRNGFTSIIAPTAEVSRFAIIADGAIVCRQAVIEAGATIGRHFHANIGAAVAHETLVGDFVTISPRTTICGGCRIGDGAFIGAHAVVKQGVTIGRNAQIAMGTVVHKDVPDNGRALGNPARVFDHAAVGQIA